MWKKNKARNKLCIFQKVMGCYKGIFLYLFKVNLHTSFGQFRTKQASQKNLNIFIVKCTRWPSIPLKYFAFFQGYFGVSQSTGVGLTWIKFAWSVFYRHICTWRSVFRIFARLSFQENSTWVKNLSFWRGNSQMVNSFFQYQYGR